MESARNQGSWRRWKGHEGGGWRATFQAQGMTWVKEGGRENEELVGKGWAAWCRGNKVWREIGSKGVQAAGKFHWVGKGKAGGSPGGASWSGRWGVLELTSQHGWEVGQKRTRLRHWDHLTFLFQVETKATKFYLDGRGIKKNSRDLEKWNGKDR